MTFRFNTPLNLSLTVSFLALALTACGGGGDGGSDPGPGTPPPVAPPVTPPGSTTPTTGLTTDGSVSAPFVRGTRSQGIFLNVPYAAFGRLDALTQSPEGAVTALDDNSLALPGTVRDIQGDASFAMGRWTAGIANIWVPSTPTVTLTEAGSDAFHYVTFNRPERLPTTGTLTCGLVAFTPPSYGGGSSVSSGDFRGQITGTATMSFSSMGAAVGLTLNITTPSSSISKSVSTTISAPDSMPDLRDPGSNADVVFVGLGTDGASYDVVGGYVLGLASGARYAGVIRFRCV